MHVAELRVAPQESGLRLQLALQRSCAAALLWLSLGESLVCCKHQQQEGFDEWIHCLATKGRSTARARGELSWLSPFLQLLELPGVPADATHGQVLAQKLGCWTRHLLSDQKCEHEQSLVPKLGYWTRNVLSDQECDCAPALAMHPVVVSLLV